MLGCARAFWAGEEKEREWAGLKQGLGWFRVSYFLFFSYFLSFQTSLKLIEFKLQFEFKPYALNQIKQCTSMNATTC